MNPPRLLVIDPSIVSAESEGVARCLRGAAADSVVMHPGLDFGQRVGPRTGYDFDGAIVLGSRASVHEPHAWADELGEWLRPVLDGERPMALLMVCYGHQLLAHLEGGRVGFLHEDGEVRRGVEVSHFRGSRLVPDGDYPVVVSHCEVVTAPPPGYRVVASRDGDARAQRPAIPCDALEHPRLPIFGVQFHPEARGGFLAARGMDAALAGAGVAAGMDRLLGAFLAAAARP